ncbi:unnamed protein product, partial [Choristocarpus tenellus]
KPPPERKGGANRGEPGSTLAAGTISSWKRTQKVSGRGGQGKTDQRTDHITTRSPTRDEIRTNRICLNCGLIKHIGPCSIEGICYNCGGKGNLQIVCRQRRATQS